MRASRRFSVLSRGVGLLVGAWCGLGASAAGQEWHGVAFRALGGPEAGVQVLEAQPGLAAGLAGSREAQVDDFPLGDGTRVSLRLTRSEILSPDAEIVVMTAGGQERGLAPVSTFWTGTVDGDASTVAFLAVSDLRVDGVVLAGERTWVVSSGPPEQVMPTVVYDLRSIDPALVDVGGGAAGGACEARTPPWGLPDGLQAADAAGGFGGRGTPCRVATIAIETDYETTMGVNGDPAQAVDYLARLMGVVSAIYTRDLNVRLEIPYMRLWTTPEDPWDQTEMGPQLDQFRGVWAASMRGVRRTLAHYLTFRGLGGGVAWVGVMCNYDYGFGLSSGVGGGFPYPLVMRSGRNWPVYVTAHELGHNFGTGHTHDSYDPPIDGCGNGDCSQAHNGTIMSYCHLCFRGMTNISLEFGPRVVERIQSYLDTVPPNCGLTGSVLFRRQPAAVTVRRGLPAVMSALASGPGVLTYHWARDGSAVEGGEDGSLEFAAVGLGDAGLYTVTADNQCASRESTSAALTVLCRADFDHDGFVDFFDYDAYVGCFEGGACPAGETADFDGDGFADFFDYDAFVGAFTGPC